MRLIQTAIPDIVVVEPTIYYDDRGWFMESFNEATFHRELQQLGLPIPTCFVQDNHSYSKKGVLRGLHYQHPPHAQGKLVRVTNGSAYDVAVDLREDSPTFGRSVGVTLSMENKRMLWIPEGFAHGFLALEDVDFLYKTTGFYNKESESLLRWNDPDLNIDWPLNEEPFLNKKDSEAPYLHEAKINFGVKQQAKGLFNLRIIGDERGSLIALENGTNLPFELRRAYYIFNTKPEVSRGYHAHKNLQQVAVCVSGKCRMLLDDGKTRESFILDSPTKGLLINNLIWREMHDFSENCILAVFASEYYNESNYIRDYDQFIKEVRNAEK